MLPESSSLKQKKRRLSHDPYSTLTSQQLLHLNSEHFSRWAGCESKATGLSPNPIILQRRRMSEARANIKSQQQNHARQQMNLIIKKGKGTATLQTTLPVTKPIDGPGIEEKRKRHII